MTVLTDDPVAVQSLEALGAAMRRSKRGNVLLVDFSSNAERTDDNAVKLLIGLPRVREVVLACSRISDDSVEYLIQLDHLTVLDVQQTKLTDKSLERLRSAKALKMLNLTGCPVSTDALSSARKSMIGTRIIRL